MFSVDHNYDDDDVDDDDNSPSLMVHQRLLAQIIKVDIRGELITKLLTAEYLAMLSLLLSPTKHCSVDSTTVTKARSMSLRNPVGAHTITIVYGQGC